MKNKFKIYENAYDLSKGLAEYIEDKYEGSLDVISNQKICIYVHNSDLQDTGLITIEEIEKDIKVSIDSQSPNFDEKFYLINELWFNIDSFIEFNSNIAPKEITKLLPKFCMKCGAPLKPNMKFCTKCGNRVLD